MRWAQYSVNSNFNTFSLTVDFQVISRALSECADSNRTLRRYQYLVHKISTYYFIYERGYRPQ